MKKKQRKCLSMAIIEAIYTLQYAMSSTSACDSGKEEFARSEAKVSDKHFESTKEALIQFVENKYNLKKINKPL